MPGPYSGVKPGKGGHTHAERYLSAAVEAIPAAHASEWRADDSFPPSETQAWQLIFVRSGTIEERCDARHVLLRAADCCSTSRGRSLL